MKTEVWNINFHKENHHLISHVAAVYKYPERNVQFGWRGDFSVHNSAICMKSENSREFGQDYNITGQFVPHYTSPTVTLDLAWNPLYFIILTPKVTSTRKWTITCQLLLNDWMNQLGMFTVMKYIKEKFFCAKKMQIIYLDFLSLWNVAL